MNNAKKPELQLDWTVAELMLAEHGLADEWAAYAKASGADPAKLLADARVAAVSHHEAWRIAALRMPNTRAVLFMTREQIAPARAAIRQDAKSGSKDATTIERFGSALCVPPMPWLGMLRVVLLIAGGAEWVTHGEPCKVAVDAALCGRPLLMPMYHGPAVLGSRRWIAGRPTLEEVARAMIADYRYLRVGLERRGNGWRGMRDEMVEWLHRTAREFEEAGKKHAVECKGSDCDMPENYYATLVENVERMASSVAAFPVDCRDVAEADVPEHLRERWRIECSALTNFESLRCASGAEDDKKLPDDTRGLYEAAARDINRHETCAHRSFERWVQHIGKQVDDGKVGEGDLTSPTFQAMLAREIKAGQAEDGGAAP